MEFIIFIYLTLMQVNKRFEEFILKIQKLPGIKEVLSKSESQYNLRKYKITEICEGKALPIYQHIVQKFYKNHDIGDSSTWVENQLRLFIWAVICFMFLNQKSINEMNSSDWDFFAEIFYVKERNLFEYQARTLLDEEARANRWSEEQDFMLYQLIMRDKDAKWNQIAKSLYINSGKRFLRPSKQCRQRWLNHLDPTKSKLGWTIRELLTLFEHVDEKGKKWAMLVKKLQDKRGQHTIKNKYNSIIKKQGKITGHKSEDELRKQVIIRLKKIQQSQNLSNNDQFILGLNSKNKHIIFETVPHYDPRFGAPFVKNDALKKKFDDFRKKIQKFSSETLKTGSNYTPTTGYNFGYSGNKCVSKVTSLIEKLKSPQKFMVAHQQKQDSSRKEQDSIFYEDSYQEMIPMQFNNQAILAEEINNFINESQLDM